MHMYANCVGGEVTSRSQEIYPRPISDRNISEKIHLPRNHCEMPHTSQGVGYHRDSHNTQKSEFEEMHCRLMTKKFSLG